MLNVHGVLRSYRYVQYTHTYATTPLCVNMYGHFYIHICIICISTQICRHIHVYVNVHGCASPSLSLCGPISRTFNFMRYTYPTWNREERTTQTTRQRMYGIGDILYKDVECTGCRSLWHSQGDLRCDRAVFCKTSMHKALMMCLLSSNAAYPGNQILHICLWSNATESSMLHKVMSYTFWKKYHYTFAHTGYTYLWIWYKTYICWETNQFFDTHLFIDIRTEWIYISTMVGISLDNLSSIMLQHILLGS